MMLYKVANVDILELECNDTRGWMSKSFEKDDTKRERCKRPVRRPVPKAIFNIYNPKMNERNINVTTGFGKKRRDQKWIMDCRALQRDEPSSVLASADVRPEIYGFVIYVNMLIYFVYIHFGYFLQSKNSVEDESNETL